MRFKRAKKVKRNMGIYSHSFGFRSPYQVILDGNFLQVARATSKTLDTALPQFMGESVRMMTTYCVYAELKKLGPDFRPTAAMAKKLEKRRCTHSPAVTAAECIKSIIGESNSHNYCIATQDDELRQHLRAIPGIPLLYINKSVLLLEPASEATMKRVNELELQKTGLQSFEKSVSQSLAKDQVKIIKKKKEPNSLSVKKKRVASSIISTKVAKTAEKPKRKRKRNTASKDGESATFV